MRTPRETSSQYRRGRVISSRERTERPTERDPASEKAPATTSVRLFVSLARGISSFRLGSLLAVTRRYRILRDISQSSHPPCIAEISEMSLVDGLVSRDVQSRAFLSSLPSASSSTRLRAPHEEYRERANHRRRRQRTRTRNDIFDIQKLRIRLVGPSEDFALDSSHDPDISSGFPDCSDLADREMISRISKMWKLLSDISLTSLLFLCTNATRYADLEFGLMKFTRNKR